MRGFFEEIVRNSPLRVRWQGDFWFFHRKDDVIFLEIGDEGQQCQQKRVQRSATGLLEWHGFFAAAHCQKEGDGFSQMFARELGDEQTGRAPRAAGRDVFRQPCFDFIKDRPQFGGVGVYRRIESSQSPADAFPHPLTGFLHAQNVVEERTALQTQRT